MHSTQAFNSRVEIQNKMWILCFEQENMHGEIKNENENNQLRLNAERMND